MSTIYVGPQASGNGSGSSAANTLSIGNLDRAIALAGPGGTVVLLSDHGDYNLTGSITLSHGGLDGAPVTIVGQDSFGLTENIVINGTRPAEYASTNAVGNTIFRLVTGANDLIFSGMTFNNVGTAFVAKADIHDLTISNMTANNVQYFLADYAAATGGTATISGLNVFDVDVHGFSKGVIRLQYDTHDVTISNVYGDSQHEDGDGLAMGIHLDGTVHGVTITGAVMENALCTTSAYWNGDGFTTERGVYDVTFTDCVSRGNADAGFDIKSTSTTLIGCLADSNARNFRLWADVTLVDCTGMNPHKYGGSGGQEQIQVLTGAHITLSGGAFADSGSGSWVVNFDNGGSIAFNGTEVVYANGAKLTTGTGSFVLDPTAVHQVAATGIYSTNGWSLLHHEDVLVAPTDLVLTGATVAENASTGTSIGFASLPAGADATGAVYSLLNNAGGSVSINPQTGELTVANGNAIDFETSSTLNVVVQVANSSGSYNETFGLTVSDQNEAPTSISFTGGSVVENSPAGTVVGTVKGVDPDANDVLTYGLSDDAGGLFTIDPKTGAVVVAAGAVLDFEQQSNLVITVVATDSHGLSSSAPVTIALQNVVESGSQTLLGTDVADTLIATSDADYTVTGLAGDDNIATMGGNDHVTGGAGNDSISTGSGNDVVAVAGTSGGFDNIDGGAGADVIRAMANGTSIGLHSISGIETISANGYLNVSISGDASANQLDFSNTNLDSISNIHGGAGDDVIIGCGGNDVIFGDKGADRLTGGAGADTFGFAIAGHSLVGGADVITDFIVGTDIIDLSAIDASLRHRGNDSFKFLGTGGFTGQGGQVRVDYSTAGVTKVYGDLDGDKKPDFEIDLVGSVPLHASDFHL